MAKRTAAPMIYKLQTKDAVMGMAPGYEKWKAIMFAGGHKTQVRKLLSLNSTEPLAAKWRTLPVNVSTNGSAGDLFNLWGGCLGLSRNAVDVLKPIVGDTVEFLPVKVVGEFDRTNKRVKKGTTYDGPDIFIARTLRLVQLAEGAVFDELDGYDEYLDEQGEPELAVWRYALHIDAIRGLHYFHVAQDSQLLVSEKVFKAITKAKLDNFGFEVLKYLTGDESKPARKSPAKLAPPKPFDFDRLGDTPRLTKMLWKQWVDHWTWIRETNEARGQDAADELEIAKPASARKLASVQKKIGRELPREFAEVLSKFSGCVSFFWYAEKDEDVREKLPAALQDLDGGGQNPMWDVDKLIEFATLAKDHAEFRNWVGDRLPFMEVGNGDLLALDMHDGNRNCPVVYLCHDDLDHHGRQLGTNFVDFMTRWTHLGCPGPDIGDLNPFYGKRIRRLNVSGRMVDRWKRWLYQGK